MMNKGKSRIAVLAQTDKEGSVCQRPVDRILCQESVEVVFHFAFCILHFEICILTLGSVCQRPVDRILCQESAEVVFQFAFCILHFN
jgi:hypothetical protein